MLQNIYPGPEECIAKTTYKQASPAEIFSTWKKMTEQKYSLPSQNEKVYNSMLLSMLQEIRVDVTNQSVPNKKIHQKTILTEMGNTDTPSYSFPDGLGENTEHRSKSLM